MAATVSVVIAALNEAAAVGAAVASAVRQAHEVIVVDGGSSDATCAHAVAAGAAVLTAAGGRAAQLNAGAAAATGAILLFLHADTRLPVDWADAVRVALADEGTALAAFRLGIDAPRTIERLLSAAANIRSRRLRLPYGDQGLAVRRATFAALGGFRPLPIMDDYDFVCRARALGRIETLPLAVATSARRWRRLGVVRSTLRNQLIVAGWHAGVDPARLARWYRR